MPAPAVIPAPLAYIKFAAVKKLVVGSAVESSGSPLVHSACLSLLFANGQFSSLSAVLEVDDFTLKKLECSKQAKA